jgi:hypothetical protein
MRLGIKLIYFDICSLNCEFSAVWHCVARIDGEIQNDLLDLASVRFGPP